MNNQKNSIVWLEMDFRSSLINMLWTFPILLVVLIVTKNVPEVKFLTGLMTGTWLASAHNVIWGWLTKKIKVDECDCVVEDWRKE